MTPSNPSVHENKIQPFSYHAFLFPFKWEILFNSIKPFGERCSLEDFEKILGLNNDAQNLNRNQNLRWQRKHFVIDQQLAYNEYNYFYDFVRDVIYDRGDQDKKDFKLKSIVRHYDFKFPQENSFFEIDTGLKDTPLYQLKIRKIQLNIYETGVGIFSYHLENDTYDRPDDILNINQFGRRIFVGGYQLPGTYYDARKNLSPNEVQFVDLARHFKISFGNQTLITEDFQNCKDFEKFEKAPFFLPKTITELITYNAESSNKNALLTTEWSYESSEARIWIAPSIDDRMFVHCWYCYSNDNTVDEKKKGSKTKTELNSNQFNENSEFWYKYTFIDHQGGESHQNISFKNEIIEKSTYKRWSDYGTLYGISKYSFTMLCSDTGPEYLLSVHETMYLKMAELSLVQRATVLRFSDEVQYINSIEDEFKKNEMIRGLYEYHIRFINKIDFREITPQEQGIELYDMIQKTMRINEQVEFLDKELNELHDYALLLEEKTRLIEEKTRSRKLDLIAYVGLPITFISLIISFISLIKDINITDKVEKDNTEIEKFGLNFYSSTWILETIGILILFYCGHQIWTNFNTKRKNKLLAFSLLFILSFIFCILLPFIYRLISF
ncbi:hypothetical protein [Emticicia agri]|uniref:Uncharacterized protein n=1 Tax=Emticicia agri TaxID=2492393 RepID=A0A4Q5LTR4_9BACT|nr:hypothetical protein [Emticicia agri]RYU93036.1 hypothetical protein EWM59_24105 [Emticicia agri]